MIFHTHRPNIQKLIPQFKKVKNKTLATKGTNLNVNKGNNPYASQ